VDLVQIRYFLALGRTLNFTRAAEQCNVTQPALTRSIQRLEEELGGPLILRERNLTQLTDLGRAMLPLLERTAAAADAVRTEAESLRRRDAAPSRLGLCSLVTANLLSPIMQELADRFATLELTLVHGTTPHLAEMLLQGDLDAALLPEAEIEPERLNRWPLYEDGFVVLAPRGHRFEALDAVPPAALNGETMLVATEADCALRRALNRLCEAADVRPELRHRASSKEGIASMVGARLGIALATKCQPLAGNVISRPLADPAARYRVMLTVVAGRPHGRAVDSFIKLARARDWRLAA
jgi:DNA-binding transcriptional LysR family regulator